MKGGGDIVCFIHRWTKWEQYEQTKIYYRKDMQGVDVTEIGGE